MGLGLKEEVRKGVVEENWKLSKKAEKRGDEDVCLCFAGEERGEHVEDG